MALLLFTLRSRYQFRSSHSFCFVSSYVDKKETPQLKLFNDAWLFKHFTDFLFAFKVAGSTGAMKSVDEERIVDVSGNLTSLDKKLVC